MDGRRFRRWCLYGGLVLGAAGCHRDSYHDNFGMPKPGQTVGAITPKGGPVGNSMLASSGPAVGQGPAAGAPVEMAPPKRPPGKGLSPNGEVALADVHVAAAFGDPPPTNRDQLLDMARMRYQKALKEDPKNKDAMLGMARLYARLGDRDKALEMYKKCMSTYPKDHAVPHELALKYGQWNDWAGAASWCEAALKIDPENRTYRKTLGFCLARAGRWDDAYNTLRQVMPEAQTRYNLARVMEHLNFPEQSRQWTMLALQADPNYADAQDFLADLDQGYQFNSPAAGQNANPVLQTGYQQPQP
jgi:tetratricopeptide (TPR) repeat protein